jgi:hypothetical protein
MAAVHQGHRLRPLIQKKKKKKKKKKKEKKKKKKRKKKIGLEVNAGTWSYLEIRMQYKVRI